MLEIVERLEEKLKQLDEMLADPENLTDRKKLIELNRQRRQIEEILFTGRRYREVRTGIDEAREIINLAASAKKLDILQFGMEYQNWYTRALKVVEILANDRLEEFISYYKIEPKRKETNHYQKNTME